MKRSIKLKPKVPDKESIEECVRQQPKKVSIKLKKSKIIETEQISYIVPSSPEETNPKEPKEKNKRPDRAKKLKERKGFAETVVKKCLRKAIIDGERKNLIIQEINKRVEACSRRYHLASLVVNLLAQEIVNGKYPITNAQKLWSTDYVRHILTGKSKCPLVLDIYKQYPQLCMDVKDRQTGDGNIYTHATTKLITNIQNMLVVNTPALIKRLVYATLKCKKQGVHGLFAVNGWQMTPKRYESLPEIKDSTKEFVKTCREMLQLENDETISKKWLSDKTNLIKMFTFRIFALKKLEEFEKKTYNIFPIARIKRNYITIDTMGFWGICKDCKILDCSLYDKDKKTNPIIKDYWASVFDIQTVKSKRFSGTISTDGIIIDIHYLRPKAHQDSIPDTVPQTQVIIDPSVYRVLGNDPGRVNIYYMAEELPDGTIRYYKLSRSQYYNDSGIKEAIEESNKWNLGIKEELELLSSNSPKGISLDRFTKYLKIILQVKDSLWKEYFKPRWSRQRFRVHAGKKRVVSKFFNRVEKDSRDGKEIVIAYGSAKFAPGGKGEISVPTTKAFKECGRRFQTKPIDEYRSTRVDYKTLQILQGVGKKNDYKKVVDVRGLLWCPSTKGYNGNFVNRDLNAALNIRRCLIGVRPEILTRSKDAGKLPEKNIVRVLKDRKPKKKN